jgi:predicted deacylase
MDEVFEIGGQSVERGQSVTVQIPVARRFTAEDVHLPVRVVRGKKPGPCLFVTAAVHGDEINGVEIVRRLVRSARLKRLRGTLLAVPVVNVYGFLQHTRYLPDRRDLNRSFPGSDRGSLAARLAHALCDEVVNRADAGVDLHTGSQHRGNLPQVRGLFDDPETRRLAESFGAPVMLSAPIREGSLRAACAERGIPVLVYEAGQALRFDELAIRAGMRGVLSVMQALEMLPPPRKASPPRRSYLANESTWVRAPESGVLRTSVRLGDSVQEGQVLAAITDPLGEDLVTVAAPREGIVIGATQMPLVHEGDALFHMAHFTRPDRVSSKIDAFAEELTESDFYKDPLDELDT